MELKSLKDYNNEKLSQLVKSVGTGIACPECGKEMVLSEPGRILLTNPPKERIHCECGYKDYKYV